MCDPTLIVDLKTAKKLTVKRFKNHDRITILDKEEKFKVTMTLRGHIEDYPMINDAINSRTS